MLKMKPEDYLIWKADMLNSALMREQISPDEYTKGISDVIRKLTTAKSVDIKDVEGRLDFIDGVIKALENLIQEEVNSD